MLASLQCRKELSPREADSESQGRLSRIRFNWQLQPERKSYLSVRTDKN